MGQEPSPINHVHHGLSRITSAYCQSPKFLEYIEALLFFSKNIEEVLFSLLQLPSIDHSNGRQLDILGELLGQTRFLKYSNLFKRDQFVHILSDKMFRLLLRARVVYNVCKSTNEDIIQSLLYIFNISFSDSGYIIIQDTGKMFVSVAIGTMLNAEQLALITQLDVVPRPMGVQLIYDCYFDRNNYFGFLNQEHAKGFGDENDSSVGGMFAEGI